MLQQKIRYLQIAFNGDRESVDAILPRLPKSNRILIEAGTPFIKREGYGGLRKISSMWDGEIVADLKCMDGAIGEVELAYRAGATAATVLGGASFETIDLFVKECNGRGIISMVDMINVAQPLKILVKLRNHPQVVILHRGRDEENTRGKVIDYKQVSKIRSKFDVLIAAAGGIDLREARSAIFNGANIVVVNIVAENDPWRGIREDQNVQEIAEQFLKTIE